jgi:hypothetical protein
MLQSMPVGSEPRTSPLQWNRASVKTKSLGKLMREHRGTADDMRAVLAAGASCQQIEDALAVCFSFNVIGRLADAVGFSVPGPKAFEAGANYVLARGYP